MNGSHDINIAQRLAIGFGLILITMTLFTGAVLVWHNESADAQRTFMERVSPLVERTRALEGAILRVGLGVRAYLLNPSSEQAQRYRQYADQAWDSLRALESLPKTPEGEALYRQINSQAERYLQATSAITDTPGPVTIDVEREKELAELRQRVVASIDQFVALQGVRTREALEIMATTRDKVSSGLVTASLLMVLLALSIAYLTTRSIRIPVQELLRVAMSLRQGDWQPALALAPAKNAKGTEPHTHSEMAQLAHAMGSAAVALEHRERRLRADRTIANATASSLDKADLTGRALNALVTHLDAQVGVIHELDSASGLLLPLAQHALGAEPRPLRIGEGIPGQAAQDRRPVLIRNIPEDSGFDVKLGYDEAPPRAVAAVPITFGETLHGVLTVASLHDFDEDAMSFLGAAAMQLGIGLHNVRAYEEVQRLLAEVRDKNQQIQAQNEELQAQNEEIQAQSEEIQSQSEELQAQQEELQTQNEELKRHSEDLRIHAALLAEADERKNQFLGVLAHELRNPMAPITNSLILLRRSEPGSEAAARALTIIERQTRHLIRLIDDLLDVTRISQGKIRIQREPLDLVEVVRTCIEDQAVALEESDLTLGLELPERPLPVLGDHTRLCQIIGNLLSNAIKFTDRGGRITLTLEAAPNLGETVLCVADNGVGMDPELIPRLFQPFSQGATGLARTYGGLGLGLALVKSLVELHEGSVEAYSDGIGKGARFIVKLPLQPPHILEGETAHAVGGRPAAGRPWRILLIEDNVDAARSLREVIQLDGHETLIAHSGPEGLQKARLFRPDLVLCDIGLPAIDGYELARRFRASEQLRSTFLVALTGYASAEDKERALAAGFDRHLAKPLAAEQLNELLEELASGRGNGGRPA